MTIVLSMVLYTKSIIANKATKLGLVFLQMFNKEEGLK